MLKRIIIALVVILALFLLIPPWRASFANHKTPTVREYASDRVNIVFGGGWEDFEDLVNRESKWDPTAQNPESSAYGLGQFLSSTWKTVDCVKTPDPYKQIDCTIKYVKARYGSPEKALDFWLAHNWY